MLADLMVVGLAAHRLWSFWFGSAFTKPALIWAYQPHTNWCAKWLAYLASCQFCVSFHVSALAASLWLFPTGQWVVFMLAAGAVLWMYQALFALVERK